MQLCLNVALRCRIDDRHNYYFHFSFFPHIFFLPFHFLTYLPDGLPPSLPTFSIFHMHITIESPKQASHHYSQRTASSAATSTCKREEPNFQYQYSNMWYELLNEE